ncbi:hypothetical protein SLS60_010916 [Paraconiothyrium brasiliense]|uniref:Non-reducing end beta-L-arabinofuranosidase-like GH127 catalytic domain-containing protein n=1 Tax=Paraconiothyrium brasiliense TaxID=300254 RepID=A0ABR3QMK3_9PLEO
MARINNLVNPRRVLTTLGIAVAAIATTVSADVAEDHGPGGTAPVRPFRLDQVQLGTGLLQEKRDRIKEFVQAYDERRFLILFNNQAGRPNPDGIEVPGGWEDGGLLSGHWTGHYLTALSQAYADQGEDVFKTKLDWMVKEIAACQDAITARMHQSNNTEQTNTTAPAPDWIPTHPGYVGALPEDTVLRLGPPRWAVYGSDLSKNTWAPW